MYHLSEFEHETLSGVADLQPACLAQTINRATRRRRVISNEGKVRKQTNRA